MYIIFIYCTFSLVAPSPWFIFYFLLGVKEENTPTEIKHSNFNT